MHYNRSVCLKITQKQYKKHLLGKKINTHTVVAMTNIKLFRNDEVIIIRLAKLNLSPLKSIDPYASRQKNPRNIHIIQRHIMIDTTGHTHGNTNQHTRAGKKSADLL